MRRAGHIGGAMLFSSMVSLQLNLSPEQLLLLSAAASAVAMFPDEDLRWHSHRGFTHSILFLTFLSIAFGLSGCALWAAMPYQLGWSGLPTPLSGISHLQVFLACSAPVVIGGGSHLMLDLMTKSGIPIFWPCGRKYSMGLFSASNPVANYGMAALGFLSLALLLGMI